MKETIMIIALLACCNSATLAQDSSSVSRNKNSLSFFATPKYYFNKPNVEVHGLHNPIKPHNNAGGEIGITYTRKILRGLFAEGGLAYGRQTQDIDIVYDLTGFDPEASQTLNGHQVFLENIHKDLSYLRLNLSVGYSYQVSKRWAIVGKAGVNFNSFLNGEYHQGGEFYLDYHTDDNSEHRLSKLTAQTYLLGKDPYWRSAYPKSWIFKDVNKIWEFYLGTSYHTNRKFISGMSAGLTFTSGGSGGLLVEYYKDHWDSSQQTYSIYLNKNITLGLRVGLDLWRF